MLPNEQLGNIRVLSLDTETTGFDAKNGDRIVEIGLVEIIDRRPSGRSFHAYLNPNRTMPEGAYAVHGLSQKFLSDKPTFASICSQFLDFIDDAKIVIHNASFDLSFLNMELARAGKGAVESRAAEVVDSLSLSRSLGRTKTHSLDALCSFYGVNNRHRVLHGALLDAQLLAEVYVAMTREQGTLLSLLPQDHFEAVLPAGAFSSHSGVLPVQVTSTELAAHEAYLDDIARGFGGKPSIWRKALSIEH